MSGLHQLATFVTNDPEVVASPWGAACTNMITWPINIKPGVRTGRFWAAGIPSARKFFGTDELTFTVPYEMFIQMRDRFQESFLTTKTWTTVREKIDRSNKAWAQKKKG